MVARTGTGSIRKLETRVMDDQESHVLPETEKPKKKSGWKAMPYIIGNETMERFASFGMLANFNVYLMLKFNMGQVFAAIVINTFGAVCNFTPVVGAFVADAYLGRFRTIASASFLSLVGMIVMTLITCAPKLQPLPCTLDQQTLGECRPYSHTQFGILILGLCGLAIGSGGIRPCSIPFAIDQFDLATAEGRRDATRFYVWYYNSQTVLALLIHTILVYIQNSVSWTLGFGIPAVLMLCSIILFFVGSRVYVHVEPNGSVFTRLVQVLLAAYKKRRIELPTTRDPLEAFHDPPSPNNDDKMPLTNQYRFLNKAALKAEDDQLNADGSSSNPWKLCSIQQVEELKCLLKIIPLWLASVIPYLAIVQASIFPISQALKMDRHIGPKFIAPAASFYVIALVTIAIVLPLYHTVLGPLLAKATNQEEGLTPLQRAGIGNIFSILLLVVSGAVEKNRRDSAIAHKSPDGVAPMSALLWLAPQYVLMGFTDIFNIVSYTEFYNRESPENMRSIANALFSLTNAGANYLSNVLIHVVHNTTGKNGQPNWMSNDINRGRLDYYYYLIAGLCGLNFVVFIFLARRYHYKTYVKNE